jgi:DNA-binding SARP family transcriptional activator
MEPDGQPIISQIGDQPLVLIEPHYPFRNTIVAWFLEPAEKTYAYALRSEDATLRTFLKNLVAYLSELNSGFGSQTIQALDQATTSPQDLADSFLADLNTLNPRPHFFILDEFDHLLPQLNVKIFFQRLIRAMPKGLHFVINSRLLSYVLWAEFVRSGDAVVIGSSTALDQGIFNRTVPEMPHLEVYGFRGGQVYVNGLPVTTWDGPLPKNLFYYLIDHLMVTRDEIFETFWPKLPIKDATNVFHVTKRKVSERLGYELTAYSGGFYRPSSEIALHYDVACFENAIAQALAQRDDQSVDHWRSAVLLYRSEFLHNIEMPWIEQRREQLRLQYAEALISLGRWYTASGNTEQAIAYFLRALREVPLREDIHRDTMTLYQRRGESEKAILQYKRLSEILKQTLNIAPSKLTLKLYDELVQV